MDRLWAPWRIKYLKVKRPKGCIFCKEIKSYSRVKPKPGNYVIFRTPHSFAMLNIFPYNNGHVMVAPIRHVRELSRLKQNEALDLFRAINTAKNMLEKTLRPHGYNIGINISSAAGAGIPGHLHVHIVPRWKGDTNFMPALFNTKVISQSLDELCRLLRKAL